MWLTSINSIYDIQLISRWNWYLLYFSILETALINILMIHGYVPANKEYAVEHFDFCLSNVHNLPQAGSPSTI
jgi:hypothetical protein